MYVHALIQFWEKKKQLKFDPRDFTKEHPKTFDNIQF